MKSESFQYKHPVEIQSLSGIGISNLKATMYNQA